jgi:chitinase
MGPQLFLLAPPQLHGRYVVITGYHMKSVGGSNRTLCRIVSLAYALDLMFALSTACSQGYMIGYYPMWARTKLPASQVNLNYLTHVNHAFAWPLADGSITSYDAVLDTSLINTVHRAGRKILISLGGASESAYFPGIAADTAKRRAFVRNVVTHITANGYDGVDLDWEGPSNAADRANEVSMVRELYQALAAENSGYLLTMAVGASNWSGQWHNYDSLKHYIDWFGVMTYDYHGSWSSHAGHNAPLYAPPFDINDWSVDLSFQYMIANRGIPGAQLILGLPFYGIEFNAPDMYQLYTPPVSYITYPDVIYKLAHNWEYVWDSVSQVPYLKAPSGTKVDSFEDSLSVTLKCQYAKEKQLAGVMIWEITQDVVGQSQPLMEAVGLAMYGTSAVVASRDEGIAGGITLYPNYPNPFNPTTTIEYVITEPGGKGSTTTRVRLVVFDLLGREVATLVNGIQEPGHKSVEWNAGGLASGVYFYRLTAGDFVQTRKLMVLR